MKFCEVMIFTVFQLHGSYLSGSSERYHEKCMLFCCKPPFLTQMTLVTFLPSLKLYWTKDNMYTWLYRTLSIRHIRGFWEKVFEIVWNWSQLIYTTFVGPGKMIVHFLQSAGDTSVVVSPFDFIRPGPNKTFLNLDNPIALRPLSSRVLSQRFQRLTLQWQASETIRCHFGLHGRAMN